MSKSEGNERVSNAVITLAEAMKITGHRTAQAFYNDIATGDVPRPIQVGNKRAVGWLEAELLDRQKRKIRERDERFAAEMKAKAKANKAEAAA